MVKVDRRRSPPTESEIIKYSCLIPKSSHIRLETKNRAIYGANGIKLPKACLLRPRVGVVAVSQLGSARFQ